MPHIGSWGTPELGLTEALSKLFGIPLGNQGQSIIRSPQVSEILPQNWTSAEQIKSGTVPSQNTLNSIGTQRNVLGANTENLGGGVNTNRTTTGGGAGGTDTGGSNVDLTKYLADLATARSYRENGLRKIQTLLDSVNQFRDRNKTLYNNAGQEITNQAESQLGQNATTGQSLAGKANAIGRNLGLSQRLSNSSSLLGNLQKMQGGVLASKGENQRSNDALFQERNDQAQTQENQLNNSRTALDTGYNDIVNSAGANYGQRLSDVQARAEALAAMNPMNSSSLSSFTPTVGAGVNNTLNGLFSGGAGNTTADAGSQNAYNPTQISDYLKKYLGAYRG